MKLKRGLSRIWAYLYRVKLARAHMPFWRVVVEARLDRRAKNWPKRFETAVAPVYVWARTIEEAEGLAALAVEGEGLEALTCDAKKCAPAAAPRLAPGGSRRLWPGENWASCRAWTAKQAPKAPRGGTRGLDPARRAREDSEP